MTSHSSSSVTMSEPKKNRNATRPEPLDFELSRHVLKKVAATLKDADKADSDWLKHGWIKPSVEYGMPVVVHSNHPHLVRIQDMWTAAIRADPTIKDEGALILEAKKGGRPVTAIDFGKYNVNPEAVQSNLRAASTEAQPPASQRTRSQRSPSPNSVGPTSPVGGIKIPKSGHSSISASSITRFGSSPELDYVIPRARPHHFSERDRQVQKLGGASSKASSLQQRTPSVAEHHLEAGDAIERRADYHDSAAPSAATTAVTLQANITTGAQVQTVALDLDNINEAIEDIIAYADWKNSESGRMAPVDFQTFLSIMRLRPSPVNALVLRQE